MNLIKKILKRIFKDKKEKPEKNNYVMTYSELEINSDYDSNPTN